MIKLKSWKTTLGGLIAGLPMVIYSVNAAVSSGSFTGKSAVEVAMGIGAILIGCYAKDHNVTGAN